MIDEETVRRLIAVELGEGEVHTINIKYDNETYNISFDADLLETDNVLDDLVKPMAIKLKTFRAKKLAEKRGN